MTGPDIQGGQGAATELRLETTPITRDRADEIMRASEHFDDLDDFGDDDELGFMYYLNDGSYVLIAPDGTMTHGDCFPSDHGTA